MIKTGALIINLVYSLCLICYGNVLCTLDNNVLCNKAIFLYLVSFVKHVFCVIYSKIKKTWRKSESG